MPVLIGMAIRGNKAELAAKLERGASPAAARLFVIIVVAAVASERLCAVRFGRAR